jgi:phage FluMu gp28-like protein
MSFGLDELQPILTDWPHVTKIPDAVGDGLLDRICQVLRTAKDNRARVNWQADL